MEVLGIPADEQRPSSFACIWAMHPNAIRRSAAPAESGAVERHRACFAARRARRSRRVAALGLARVPETDRHVAGDLAREREEAMRVAGLQLDLGLADRRRPLARADLPAVDRELRGGAVRERDHPRGAVELGREHRLEALAHALAREEPPVRRLVEHRRGRAPRCRERPFDLFARVQPRGREAVRLERLDAPFAAAPDA